MDVSLIRNQRASAFRSGCRYIPVPSERRGEYERSCLREGGSSGTLLEHDVSNEREAMRSDTVELLSTRVLLIGGLLFLVGALVGPVPLHAQDAQQPTVDRPVRISVDPVTDRVAPGERSALVITFRVPKYMWLGAKPGQDRSPAGTRIKMADSPNFQFEEPVYPEPSVEGVPVHLGVTRVYMGEVTVIVPYRVAEDAEAGTHDVKALLTYTPGFSAGKLSTHVNEPYTATVQVQEGASTGGVEIPEPSMTSVPEDFQVKPKERQFPAFLGPMFHKYEEGTAFTRLMHTLFLDSENHGKRISHATYPFLSSTRRTGENYGVGVAVLNATKEGVMTGASSLLAYSNEYVGTTVGFDHITCPAAYHNLQMTFRTSGEDFTKLDVKYENFVLGENDRWGIQANLRTMTDPRFRFYGVGPGAEEGALSIYDHEEAGGYLDVYHLPMDKLRVGVGYKFRDVGIDEGITDITDDDISDGFDFAPQIDERFSDEERVTGSTITGGRFNLIYDGRNQEFNPTKGFFGKVTAELNHVLDDEGANLEDNYGTVKIDTRKYFSTVDQEFQFLLRNRWQFTTSNDVPFYELADMGGPKSLRAFERGRFHGQHAGFASAEARYVLSKVTIMGFPMAVVMGGFVDVGQVFNDTDQLFNDEFNVNPGASLRFVNYPNVGYVLNIAQGDDGINVTGGISLPF